MICPYCELDRSIGHAEDCILGRDTGQRSKLRAVAFLSRIDTISDREPMIYSDGRPIPWLVALNLDPSRY